MNIDSASLVYFSPTETTKKIIAAIASGVGVKNVNYLNLTLPEVKEKPLSALTGELAIIGMPVYAGRLPAEAVERFHGVKGNRIPAIIVVLYGNRAYEDALIELRDVAIEAGFIPVAAGAFVGEHSFSNENSLIAHQRPDADDLARASEFGNAVRTRMGNMRLSGDVPPLMVPGNFPYQEYRVRKNVAPISDAVVCTRCETCATVCPTAAISAQDNAMVTDASLCILCCACVKSCTTGARELIDERIANIRGMLTSKFSQRKEPEIFFSM